MRYALMIIGALMLAVGEPNTVSAFSVEGGRITSGQSQQAVVDEMKRKGFVAKPVERTVEQMKNSSEVFSFFRANEAYRIGTFCAGRLVSWSDGSLVNDAPTFIRRVKELTTQHGRPGIYEAVSIETDRGQVNSLSFAWSDAQDIFKITYTPGGKLYAESISSYHYIANACTAK